MGNDAHAGDEVEISGLRKMVHLNGTKGRLVRFVNKVKRWSVECFDDRTYKIKPENLSVPAAPIRETNSNAGESLGVTSYARKKPAYAIMRGTVPNHPSVKEVLGNTYILPNILGFLNWKELLQARVCRRWREAVRCTPVPESRTADSWQTPELYVGNREAAEALGWLSNALPMLTSLNFLFDIGKSKLFQVANGEDAGPSLMVSTTLRNRNSQRPVDISCIANFHHLRNLAIHGLYLNGRYPFLFEFSNLRTLEFYNLGRLKWDLSILVNMPNLEKLRCISNHSLTGSISDTRVLKETLKELGLSHCTKVDGNLKELADFPMLRDISLHGCKNIVGDIRDIRPGDFQSIESMGIPASVWGGGDLPSIEETPDIMHAWYILKKQHSKVFTNMRLGLSLDSPERYDNNVHHSRVMPSLVEFVQAGNRLGWRWTNCVFGGACETNWLDPKPSNPSLRYTKELQKIYDDVTFYEGFLAPPTQEEHLQRYSEFRG